MEKYSSERIFLREINIADIDERVMLWFEDQDLMKYYSTSKNKITKEILIDSILKGKETGNVFTYGVFTIENRKLIGTIKIGPINHAHKISDLVALIGDRDFLGKGLAVEAITLGNQLSFNEFGIRKLFGGMYESNIASIKAYRKAGWIVEGRLKGHYFVNGRNEDRILVGCFNPEHFTDEEIQYLKDNENRFLRD